MSTSNQRSPGVLAIRDVHVQVGDVRILQQIDLGIRPGELCALVGPSGAGKSTLIKVLLGLRDPNRGTVALGGRPVGDSGPIGYVPQDDALHSTLTVRQALDFSAQLRLPHLDAKARTQRLEEVCLQVGLDQRLDLKIKKLSGGQRKRVSVALELLTKPPVLILDEPTSGLDPGLEARMMELFAGLAASGRSVLVATHAMQSLEKCHAMILLVGGHLAWYGRPRDALTWFRAERFEDIFHQLPKMKPEAWGRRYMRSPEREAFSRRAGPALPVSATAPVAAEGSARAPGAASPPAPSSPVPVSTAPTAPASPEADTDCAQPSDGESSEAEGIDAQLAALKARLGGSDS